MTNVPASQPVTPDRRAAMVAEIRALADFVETRTDLPVPTSINAQATLPGRDPAHADTVRAVAEALGVEADIYDASAGAQFRLSEYPAMVGYTVYGVLNERVR